MSASRAPGVAGRPWRESGGAGPAALLARRSSWLLLAVVVAVALALGSAHRGPETDAARIAYLDGIIKCPVCANVSIAQSDAQQAVNLRAKVAALVHGGRSDAEVEAYVVARFGTTELLRPSNPVLWILPVAGGAVAAAALGVVLVRRRGSGRGTVAGPGDESLVSAALADRARVAPGHPGATGGP